MMMRSRIILLFCFAMALAAFDGRLVLAESFRYGVLDTDRVMEQSVAYVEFKNRWNKVNERYQKEIEFYESQLIDSDKKVKGAAHASQEKLVQIKQKVVLYESKVQALMQKRKEVSEEIFNKVSTIMRENIEKLVYEYAQANKLAVIFSRAQVMYFSSEVDITEPILKNLNKTLIKIDVDI